MSIPVELVEEVRAFNRFYANITESLNQHILDGPLSMTELRVLYEISQQENCTAGKLITITRIDGGYLSRMVKTFEKEGWLTRKKSVTDARTYYLHITSKGKKLLDTFNEKSNKEVQQLLTPVPVEQQQTITGAMKTIRQVLAADPQAAPPVTAADILFREQLLPGDVGYLIYLHGQLYAKEAVYNLEFESYVCKTFHEFLQSYNSGKDRVFLATYQDQIIGAVAILASSRHLAQLRWFLVHPDFRGLGLGKRLLTNAINFCREKNYQTVYLMTTSMQTTAAELYKKAGFRKTGEKYLQMWGQHVYEQRYELAITR
jgi:DNA-binding MarR family transcriptional regulator/ribosomal protein S18 acetylase RimI-like enzyme